MKMFKKAKRKIVVSILSILCAVLIGTLVLIYLTSYFSVTSQNYEILEKHAEMFENIKDTGPRNDMEPVKGEIRGRGSM